MAARATPVATVHSGVPTGEPAHPSPRPGHHPDRQVAGSSRAAGQANAARASPASKGTSTTTATRPATLRSVGRCGHGEPSRRSFAFMQVHGCRRCFLLPPLQRPDYPPLRAQRVPPTSMQDSPGEPRPSTYFRKDEIIAAIAGEAVARSPRPRQRLRHRDPRRWTGARRAFLAIQRVDASRAWPAGLQVWGGGASPALAESSRVRSALRARSPARATGARLMPHPGRTGRPGLVGLLPGFVFQHALLGDVTPPSAPACGRC